MEFKIQKRKNENIHHYPSEDLKIANDFAGKLKLELGDFLISVIIFGSSARKTATPASDIDILVIGDDISFHLTDELTNAYRIIVENVIADVSTKLHVTSMTFTSFWEYVRAGDPVAVNILRDGIALIDTGFFEPLQILLKQGRIRPTEESIWRYFGRAPRTLLNSRWHLLQATLDLYWACIDSAHAALMRKNITPTSPEHVADIIQEKLVSKKLLEPEYVSTMRKFYKLNKMITHREVKEISGSEYDNHLKEAQKFVKRMQEFIEKEG